MGARARQKSSSARQNLPSWDGEVRLESQAVLFHGKRLVSRPSGTLSSIAKIPELEAVRWIADGARWPDPISLTFCGSLGTRQAPPSNYECDSTASSVQLIGRTVVRRAFSARNRNPGSGAHRLPRRRRI